MKFCPQCQTGFPDRAETCPTHGILLSEILNLKSGMLIRNTYRIVRKLGDGGMGSVYLAEQTLMEEMRALKFLARHFSNDQDFIDRFRREVRTLRQVRHQNVIDCGDLERAEDDSFFFAMEYVDGPDLQEFMEQAGRPLEVKLALEIARGIAQGLGAAHAKGMVHRDIKPENILMAPGPDGYIPKVADFGIVATKEGTASYTRTGQPLLTVIYAAPEQWEGMPASEFDGRTDLYALGGVMFAMLTGQTAFQADSYQGWAMQHLRAPAPPPSKLRKELSAWRGLDDLVLGLLAKDRNDRPQNVGEVLRLLEGVRYGVATMREEPVAQRPQERTETVFEPAQPRDSRPPEPIRQRSARQSRKWPRRFWAFMVHHFGLFGALWALFMLASFAAFTAAFAWRELLPFLATAPKTALVQLRPCNLCILQTAEDGDVSDSNHSSVAFSPDGKTLAALSWMRIELWNVEKRSRQCTLQTSSHGFDPDPLAFSPDGRILAVSNEHGVQLWDMARGVLHSTLQVDSFWPPPLAFSPDGRILATGNYDDVKLWDVVSSQPLRTIKIQASEVRSVAFSPDSGILASGNCGYTIKMNNVASGELLRTLEGHTACVESVAFSPDGRTLASGSDDHTIKLWDAVSGNLLLTLQGHADEVKSVVFSPTGRTLASGSKDDTVKIWDVATGRLIRTLKGEEKRVNAVAFSPDGRTLASGDDRSVKLWDVANLEKK